jgi:hypothetical protein
MHPETVSVINYGSTNMNDLEKLKSTIAQDPEILDVLDVASEWWISWRDQQWVIRDSGVDPTAKSFVKSRLESDNPAVYATGLMCLAMSLHRIRPGLDDVNLNLSAPPMVLFDRIVTAIDQVILTQQNKDSTTILLALQRAKTHAEGDQLRKSWLRIRHAILLSQHLDFANDLEIAEDELLYRQRWVGGIYEMDHFMSLVLGFPHARDKNFTDRLAKVTLARGDVDVKTRMRALRRIVAVAAGRVNQRNASGTEADRRVTDAVQQDLSLYGSMMPPEWWDTESQLASDDMRLVHEHLMTQMWYWEIQAFLHLPHMLNMGDPEHHQSRSLCLQACRSMLNVFCVLRGTPALSVYICSCEDFQGVITSAMLLIGILLGISEAFYPSVQTFEDDMAVLEEVKDIFRYRAGMQGGSISRQGLKVVETLESFLLDSSGGTQSATSDKARSIMLPYFGLIHIEPQISPLKTADMQMEQLDLSLPPKCDQQHASSAVSDQATDYTSTAQSHDWTFVSDHDSPLVLNSIGTLDGSPSDFSSGGSEAIFDKPLPIQKQQIVDFDPPANDLGDLNNWDQFLYGDELAQDWDIPGWEATFNVWNEDVLSHEPVPARSSGRL